MRKQKFSTLLNILGIVLTGVGGYFFLFPTITLRLIVALVLIVSGTILQAKFERFDIYGKTYAKWLDEKIQDFLQIEMTRRTNLGGRKVLSTMLNLFGIPIFVLGLYLVMFPIYHAYLALAGVSVGLGVYLQVMFYPNIGQGKHKESSISD